MTLENFSAAVSLGFMLGFIAWSVFRSDEAILNVKRFAAFFAALLVAIPAKFSEEQFASYVVALTLGFFSRSIAGVMFLKSEGNRGNFENQIF